MITTVESGWNLWVWLVVVVCMRWVWVVGEIYGCGYQEVSAVRVYRCG